jgi:hypothetical protein
MRKVILFVLVVSATTLKAQTFIGSGLVNSSYRAGFNTGYVNDSISKKKWSLSKYSGISTSFSFFRGGNATVVSAPFGLQLNRRLNNNLFAFAGISAAPAYVSFNRSFMAADLNKANQNNPFYKANSLAVYSRAELGLQYVNDEKTFSISGSFGVERSSYPAYQYNRFNGTQNQVISTNKY